MASNKPDRMPEFYQGYRSFNIGNLVNPHRVNTLKHREWEHGFNTGYFDCLRKLEAAS